MIIRRTKNGRFPLSVAGICGVLLVVAVALCAQVGYAAQIEVDLDRATPGVQSTLTGESPILGAVVVTGLETDDAGRYSVQLLVNNTTQATAPVVCAETSAAAGDVADGAIGVTFNCTTGSITRANLFSTNVDLGADGAAVMFTFDLGVTCADGDEVTLNFQTTANNPQLGVNVNGSAQSIGSANFPAVGATFTCGTGGGGTPTARTPCPDAGYYVLDAFGGRHSVGAPFPITGSLYFGDNAFARDMELVDLPANGAKGAAGTPEELAVLDLNGVVHYVADETASPGQSFFFPDGPEAVDVEIKADNLGFYVLTVDGGIYGAGTGGSGLITGALQSVLNIPFGGSVPRDPGLDPAQGSIRAVALGVSQTPAAVNGFIVLDSQGGHYLFDAAGAELAAVVNAVLDPAAVYPFFKGLDVARDLEMAPNDPTALIIYDGWGGTHPVPVSGGSVDFIRNEGTFASATGLPYVQASFDDPSTAADESAGDIDVNSIFKDLEFCVASTDDSNSGVYVLDKFGAVFAYGSTRADQAGSPAPILAGAPYFFPSLFAVDLEPTNRFPDPQ